MKGLKLRSSSVVPLALAVALVLGLVAVPANASVIKPACEDQQGTAEITGRVLDATTGAPVAGVEVAAQRLGDEEQRGWAISDADGLYEMDGLPAGDYEVYFSAGCEGDAAFYSSATYKDPATSESVVPVADGQVVTLSDTSLEAGLGVASGVVSFNGSPVACAGVVVWSLDEGTGSWNPFTCTSTESDGSYSISLEPGTYRISAAEPGVWEDSPDDGSPYRLKPLCEERELTLSTETFFDGALDVASATDVPVVAKTVFTADIALLPNPDVAVISGTVTGPGGVAVPEAEVTAYQLDECGNWEETDYDAETDANGAYSMPALAGTYRLRVVPCDETLAWAVWPNAVTLPEGSDVTGVAGQTTAADFSLAAGGAITGTLTDQNGTGPEDCKGFRLTLMRLVGEEWTPVAKYRSKTAEYTLAGLPAGTYRLKFDGPRSWLEPFYYLNASTVTEATDIEVAEGATVALEPARFPGEAPSITDAKPSKPSVKKGQRVKLVCSVDSCGDGVAGAKVAVYASTGHGWKWLTSTTTNAAGDASVSAKPKSTTAYRFVFSGKRGIDGSKDQVKVKVHK